MKKELSVVIPCYNNCCGNLAERLVVQLLLEMIDYEVIVVEDGSTDPISIASNCDVDRLPHCRYIKRDVNVGRAAIRNFLAKEAKYKYVLFIDNDMNLEDKNFIHRYVECPCDTVIDGGVFIDGGYAYGENPEKLKHSLRYLYEKAEEKKHSVEQRRLSPYQHLHTANLLVRRDLILAHPFDERFRRYGYEDVLLGKTFKQHHIHIEHIDNPLVICRYEPNAVFVAKTEEGLQTLYEFRKDLRGFSRLLTLVENIHIPPILAIIRLWHRLFGAMERRNLCGKHPNLTVFKLYKLGYFTCFYGGRTSRE